MRKIALVVVLVVVGIIALAVAAVFLNEPYVSAHMGVYTYCRDNNLAEDCDRYEKDIFSRSSDAVMACQRKWSHRAYPTLFDECLVESGIVTP